MINADITLQTKQNYAQTITEFLVLCTSSQKNDKEVLNLHHCDKKCQTAIINQKNRSLK